MPARREVVLFEGRAGEEAFSRHMRAVSLGSRPSFVRLSFVEPDGARMPGFHVRETPYGEEAVAAVPKARRRKAWTGRIDEMWLDAPDEHLHLAQPDTLVHLPEGVDPGGAFLKTSDGWRRKGRSAPTRSLPERVIVVGAGLAGAFVTEALQARGVRVTVLDAHQVPAAGASALCCGLLHPHWQASDNPLFALTRAGFACARETLLRHPDCWAPVGVLDVARDEETERAWMAARAEARPFPMPSDFARWVSRDEAQSLSGLSVNRSAWWYEGAGLVRVGRLARTLLAESGAPIRCNTRVSLERRAGEWLALTPAGEVAARADAVVIAAGCASAGLANLSEILLPIEPLYGRISLLGNDPYPGLRTALTGHGYLGKLDGFVGVGATYERGDARVLTVEAAHKHNFETFGDVVAPKESPLPAGFYEGIRAVSADRLPVVGAAPDAEALRGLAFRGVPQEKDLPTAEGLWLCTAMGSRGITWGRLCAQTLVREMAGEAPLLEAALVGALSPLRFAARAYRASGGKALF